MTHHQVFTAAPATDVPFDPSAIMFVILFVWSHWGLWIYLNGRGRSGRANFLVTLTAGPAALVDCCLASDTSAGLRAEETSSAAMANAVGILEKLNDLLSSA